MSGVYVWLALADLRAAGACQEGMAEAESMARGQGREDKIRLRWDPLGSAWFWDAYPDYASWLAINGLIPPSATAGEGGTATAGEGGEVHIRHYDGRRYRIAVGYVGEDDIDPGTAYVVTEGKLTRKVSP